MLGGAAKKSKTDIRFFLDPDILTIVADRLLIEQVIVNLVRNAIEALTEHGADPTPAPVAHASDNYLCRSGDHGLGGKP